MSDHYLYNNSNDTSDEDTEKFAKAIRLHHSFQKDIEYSENFIKRKTKEIKRKRIITFTTAIILILSAIVISIYFIFPTKTDSLPKEPIEKETVEQPIIIDSELDLIIAEHFTKGENEEIVKSLKDNFGHNFKSNLYFTGRINTVLPSDTLTSELVNTFSLNGVLSAEEQSNILKMIIAAPQRSEVPLILVVINNLAEAGEYTKRTGKLFLDLEDLDRINKRYSEIVFMQNKEVNKTTQLLFTTSKITIPKKIIRF